MKKSVILIVLALAIVFSACKKNTSQQYCYRVYEFFERYPSTGTPADSFSYVDTTTVICQNKFSGDTMNSGTINTWTLNGSFYYKGTTFEVYQH